MDPLFELSLNSVECERVLYTTTELLDKIKQNVCFKYFSCSLTISSYAGSFLILCSIFNFITRFTGAANTSVYFTHEDKSIMFNRSFPKIPDDVADYDWTVPTYDAELADVTPLADAAAADNDEEFGFNKS